MTARRGAGRHAEDREDRGSETQVVWLVLRLAKANNTNQQTLYGALLVAWLWSKLVLNIPQ